MPFCIALAVREMRMTPAEALWAATAGGARALRRHDIGHLGIGARADLIILDAPSHVHLAYRPGVPLVRTSPAQWSAAHDRRQSNRTGVSAADVLAVARGDAHGSTIARRRRRRDGDQPAIVDDIERDGRPVYGVSTGFGALANTFIAPDAAPSCSTR